MCLYFKCINFENESTPCKTAKSNVRLTFANTCKIEKADVFFKNLLQKTIFFIAWDKKKIEFFGCLKRQSHFCYCAVTYYNIIQHYVNRKSLKVLFFKLNEHKVSLLIEIKIGNDDSLSMMFKSSKISSSVIV